MFSRISFTVNILITREREWKLHSQNTQKGSCRTTKMVAWYGKWYFTQSEGLNVTYFSSNVFLLPCPYMLSGSHVFCAPLDQYIGRPIVDRCIARHNMWVNTSTDTRPIYQLRYVDQEWLSDCCRHVHREATDILPSLHWYLHVATGDCTLRPRRNVT